MKYFRDDEFKCKCGCGMDVQDELKEKIKRAREIAGVPFFINSGARCKEHNKKVGGTLNSSHIKGLAVDISYQSKLSLTKMVHGLSVAGFKRFGVSENFIHVDLDRDKKDGFWGY